MTAAADSTRPGLSKREEKTRARNLNRLDAKLASERARADFAAALDALEDKLNVPKQIGIRIERLRAKASAFYEDQPGAAIAAAVGAAAVVAGAVVLVVRAVAGDD